VNNTKENRQTIRNTASVSNPTKRKHKTTSSHPGLDINTHKEITTVSAPTKQNKTKQKAENANTLIMTEHACFFILER